MTAELPAEGYLGRSGDNGGAAPNRQWTGVIYLSLGAFAVGCDAFVLSAIIPEVARDLATSIQTAGLFTVAYALSYAILAPLMTAMGGRLGRSRSVTLALGVFALANLYGSLTTSVFTLILARVGAGAAGALYMPTATAAAASLVPKDKRGRALSVVLGGLTVASAVGVPLGAIIASAAGWRAVFIFMALLSLIALICLRSVGFAEGTLPASFRTRISIVRKPVIGCLLLTTIVNYTSIFTIFAYFSWAMSPLLGGSWGLGVALIGLYGLAGVVSLSLSAKFIDKLEVKLALLSSSGVVVFCLGGLAVLSLEIVPSSLRVPALFFLVAVWSLASWTINPLQQKLMLDTAGPRASDAFAFNSSALYVGQSIGAVVGGLFTAYGSFGLFAAAFPTALIMTLIFAVVLPKLIKRGQEE